MPEQLHAVSADGVMTVVDYERGQQRVKCTPAQAVAILLDDKLHRWMKTLKTLNPPVELPVMGLVNNYDGTTWRVQEMADMLASPTARKNLVRDLADYAGQAHEAGIVVDFEEIPDKSQDISRILPPSWPPPSIPPASS
jgi:hypothetical protein